MKFPLSNCVLLISFLIVGLCYGLQSSTAVDELRQIPEIALDRKSEFVFSSHVLKAAGPDQRRYGFAFKTPTLVDGSATCLVVWDHENPEVAWWEVSHADGSVLISVSSVSVDLSKYPQLVAKFPNAKSVQKFSIENYDLVKATRYQVVVTTRAERPPLGISMNVAASGVGVLPGGEIREMKIPEGPIPSQGVIELLENIRTIKGDAAGIKFLEEQFAVKAERNEGFESLFTKVWNEAQFGAGMNDPMWRSRLNDTAFTSAYKIGDYARAFEIMNNLCSTLGSAARFGRLSEVHAIFADAYERGGLNMDPKSYPDLGPAIPGLPMVRRREISMVKPYSKQAPPGAAPISELPEFQDTQARALLSYAYQRMHHGDWQGAIEWAVWLRDWASDENENPTQPRNEIWYSATFDIATQLENLGYYEEALALIEKAVAAPYGKNYRGRHKITASHMLLDLKRQVGRPDPEMVPKFRELVTVMENHVHFGKTAAWSARVDLASALFHVGQFEEGEKLLDALIAEGSYSARWVRLARWFEIGKTEGVEAELIAMLKNTRESGHKIIELSLYSRYADFLETAGRFQEALTMRHEAIRLARDFNAFTRLPVQLAKLAAQLHKLGHADLAAHAADEARLLLKAVNMPLFTIEGVTKGLAEMGGSAPAVPKVENKAQALIDLQPHRGLVIPIKGAPWTSYLTLANPGSLAVRGTLEISGSTLTTRLDEETDDIRIVLGEAGQTSLALTLSPSSYRLITVTKKAGNEIEGELKFNWRADAGNEIDEARVVIEAGEQGVAGAIIQAGEYQANPFYGVPIHLSYVAKDKRAKSSPLRFKASQIARIEIYRLDGTPLAVDSVGNGSLLDAGDALYTDTDGVGNLLLGLDNGGAALYILAYPKEEIAKDGLKIDIEAFDDGRWNLHSSNRILR